MTLSPNWQAGIINDYKQIRGELAKPENANRKAVIDMKMTERLNEMVKIAWQKGYISDEVKKQLGSLTPEELAGAFALGGVIGIIGTTEAGAAALGPVGGAVGLAYTIKQMAEFDHIADGCARATNRGQLDKPAKEFGEFLGSLSKDGVLALVGLAGGMTAPRVMPQVEEVLTNKVGNVKQILNQGVPKLEEPRLATPNGAPAETTNIKPTGKTALENSEPLEMTSSEYKDLRGKTPSKEIRDAVNPNGPKIDPIYKYYVERLEADHIVSMKEITEMPGFENLSKAQQVEVLNLRDNFLGLGKATNASKGAKTWAEWAGHKEMGKIPTDVRLRMLEIEKQARIEVQKAIDVRLQKK